MSGSGDTVSGSGDTVSASTRDTDDHGLRRCACNGPRTGDTAVPAFLELTVALRPVLNTRYRPLMLRSLWPTGPPPAEGPRHRGKSRAGGTCDLAAQALTECVDAALPAAHHPQHPHSQGARRPGAASPPSPGPPFLTADLGLTLRSTMYVMRPRSILTSIRRGRGCYGWPQTSDEETESHGDSFG